MIKRLLQASDSVFSAAVLVGLLSVLSRVVGLLRDRWLSSQFGAGDELDIFFAAFRVPDFLFQLLVLGTISVAFIPIFTKYYPDRSKSAWEYANKILYLVIFGFSILAGLGIWLAPMLVNLTNIGFSPEKQQAVVELMRIIFIAQLAFGGSVVFGSVLQGARRFFLYSFAPIVNNLGILVGAWLFYPVFGLVGLAWGAVLGAVAHATVQLIGVVSLGYRPTWPRQLLDADVIRTIKVGIPRVFSLATGQITFLVLTVLSTIYQAGSVTIFQFANNLNYFVVGALGVSYGIASYPTFVAAVNAKDFTKLQLEINRTVRQVIWLIIPITVITLLLRTQIVRLVYGAGEFDWLATVITANTLAFFAIGFFAQCLVFVLARAVLSLGATWMTLWSGLLGLVVTLGTAYYLAPIYGLPALAGGVSLGAMVQLAVLWVYLHGQLPGITDRSLLLLSVRVTLAGISTAIVVQIIKIAFGSWWPLDNFFAVFFQTSVGMAFGLLSYFAIMYFIFNSSESRDFLQAIRRRSLKRATPVEVVGQMADL